MLQIRQVSFGFDPHKMVLNGIHLQVPNDSVVAIVGASGCGKSTFLRLLCGILPKNNKNKMEGEIKIDGLLPMEYTKQGKVGFMFQDPTLFPNLNVHENIALPLRLRNSPGIEEVDKLTKMVGLSEYRHYLPKDLSGGMKTRVALARTFVTKPRLLLLDEPFSALDIKWKFCLYKELEALRQAYAPTVIIVTHDIQEALLLSNHILVFGKDGSVVKELLLKKPLPRVFEMDAIKKLQDEYINIQELIMNN